MRCQDLRVVQLEQLRRLDRESLGSMLQDMHWKEVRELAQAAGLQTIHKDSNNSWVAVGELRAAWSMWHLSRLQLRRRLLLGLVCFS